MVCVFCPTAAVLGGLVGSCFGIAPPRHSGGRILSAAVTANLVSISVIGLKLIFNVSLCKGGGFTVQNIFRVGSKALILGVVYSIGVNYLLNNYVYSPVPIQSFKNKCCCAQENSSE